MKQLTPARARALLNLLDLAHFFIVVGPRVERGEVIDYLARANGTSSTKPATRERALERTKKDLRELGFEVRVDADGPHHFVTLPQASRVVARLDALLDELEASRTYERGAACV